MSKIENTFAWGKSGGSSEVTREEFDNLQTTVTGLSNLVDSNGIMLNTLTEKVDGNGMLITQMKNDVDGINATVNNLNNQIFLPRPFTAKDYVDYGNFVDSNNRNIRIVVFWGRLKTYEFPVVQIIPKAFNETNNFTHVINIQTAISYYDTTHPALWLILYREDNQLVVPDENGNIDQYFRFYGWYSGVDMS